MEKQSATSEGVIDSPEVPFIYLVVQSQPELIFIVAREHVCPDVAVIRSVSCKSLGYIHMEC